MTLCQYALSETHFIARRPWILTEYSRFFFFSETDVTLQLWELFTDFLAILLENRQEGKKWGFPLPFLKVRRLQEQEIYELMVK